tara:strand:+ start:118 stop:921 length:804 start_codon:yes stop_codon:yes gene_type:complete
MYSSKVDLDKFYTKKDAVLKCLSSIDFSLYDFVIEPSAGDGAFYNEINHDNKIGIDILPESPDIILKNWFDYEIEEKYKKVLVIGNPPFGKRNYLSKKFLQHSCSFNNVYTIGFILPNVYFKHTHQRYVSLEFRLKDVLKLDDNAFTINGESYHVPCSFFIFEKSEGVCLRFKPELYKETKDWEYGDKDNYDFFVMGASINTIKDFPTINNRGYYIKVKENINIEKVKDNFKTLKCEKYSSVSGGVAWMTKPELVKNYKESYNVRFI